MSSLLQRPARANTHSQRGRFWLSNVSEIVLLAVIWLILVTAFLLAHYGQSPKLQRYELEWLSYTPAVTRPHLLADTCGNQVIATLYEHRNEPRYGIDSACPNTATSQLPERVTTAQTQFSQVQQALADTWHHQGVQQRKDDLVTNETARQAVINRLHSRQTWLGLNAQGQLESLTQLLVLTSTGSIKPIDSTSTTAPVTIALDKVDQQALQLSLLAVADGNRRFPYNRLFINQPALATLLNRAANDLALVYEANSNHNKAQQAMALLPLIGTPQHLGMLTQVFLWSWLTLGLLWLSRHRHPIQLVAIALMAWGAVIALISHDVILPMMTGVALFCIGALASALSFFAPLQRLMARLPDQRSVRASPWIYPLFVGFIGFGLLILFDLSARSYLSLRYLFLNHFKDIFWCFVVLSLARPLGLLATLGLKYGVANNVLHSLWGNNRAAIKVARGALVVTTVGYLGLALLIRHDSAKVAELGKLWLMVFLALFLALNQRTLIKQLLLRSKKMTALLAFAVIIPFIALAIANEKGTMLVMLFMFTFLVGVALSNRIFQMGGRGYITGVLGSTAILLLLMMLLVNLSGFDDRTAERVSAWMNPFVANNDQMAILHWFRDSVPWLGYGLGDIPWCGYHISGCQGVPLQMQSDYTITSVMAVIGVGPTVIMMVVYFAWLLLMARQQMAFANEQIKSQLLTGGYFILSWVILLWVVLTIFQALVTISGNLGMLPLTGVTLPFLSYGTSNLWLNSLLLSLALFQPRLAVEQGGIGSDRNGESA